MSAADRDRMNGRRAGHIVAQQGAGLLLLACVCALPLLICCGLPLLAAGGRSRRRRRAPRQSTADLIGCRDRRRDGRHGRDARPGYGGGTEAA